ncbi:hypothetical protein [Gordonia sp. DT101]|uniref:hypothetical protein n=1 Tax=Gordonia sp. DT101 TaxID=3416545 RepID=UPI003CF8CFF9
MDVVSEISELVIRERQTRVRRLAEENRACYTQDATIETSWMNGSPQTFDQGDNDPYIDFGPLLNRCGPPAVNYHGSRGVVEYPSATIVWMPVNGVEAILTSYMRLIYRVERRAGVWLISEMHAVNESDTLEPAVPGTDLSVDPEALKGLRHSYRFLAHTRALVGTEVSQDLLGIDRPENVDALYAAANEWMRS